MRLEFDFKNLWSAVAGLAPQVKSGELENEYSTVWLGKLADVRTLYSNASEKYMFPFLIENKLKMIKAA